jgi:hypothetical protein
MPAIFKKRFMKADINGSARGIRDNNKLYVIKQFQAMSRYFSREIDKKSHFKNMGKSFK